MCLLLNINKRNNLREKRKLSKHYVTKYLRVIFTVKYISPYVIWWEKICNPFPPSISTNRPHYEAYVSNYYCVAYTLLKSLITLSLKCN
jgi:hypothetical protein